jgi:hypothetical protein
VARATANPSYGTTPLAVSFDGSSSDDPDGDTLSYAWDLDGDGKVDDAELGVGDLLFQAATVFPVGVSYGVRRSLVFDLDQNTPRDEGRRIWGCGCRPLP